MGRGQGSGEAESEPVSDSGTTAAREGGGGAGYRAARLDLRPSRAREKIFLNKGSPEEKY